ncbi:MAG TPA: VOC family protein [Dehalococcoidia bacterium]|nr:VOC family protein [Dehalococcoidia bacterium]
MIRLTRLDHFGIEVTDLRRAERFYTETLGLPVRTRIGDHQVLLDCGDAVLALIRVEAIAVDGEANIRRPLGRGHWAFEVSGDDFRRAQAGFTGAGIPVHGPIDWGDHDCLYFTDPDGNLLELINNERLYRTG